MAKPVWKRIKSSQWRWQCLCAVCNAALGRTSQNVATWNQESSIRTRIANLYTTRILFFNPIYSTPLCLDMASIAVRKPLYKLQMCESDVDSDCYSSDSDWYSSDSDREDDHQGLISSESAFVAAERRKRKRRKKKRKKKKVKKKKKKSKSRGRSRSKSRSKSKSRDRKKEKKEKKEKGRKKKEAKEEKRRKKKEAKEEKRRKKKEEDLDEDDTPQVEDSEPDSDSDSEPDSDSDSDSDSVEKKQSWLERGFKTFVMG